MFLYIAQELGLSDMNLTEVKKQVKVYLSFKYIRKWFLVFDNIDDREI
jgi:hypothetical protein